MSIIRSVMKYIFIISLTCMVHIMKIQNLQHGKDKSWIFRLCLVWGYQRTTQIHSEFLEEDNPMFMSGWPDGDVTILFGTSDDREWGRRFSVERNELVPCSLERISVSTNIFAFCPPTKHKDAVRYSKFSVPPLNQKKNTLICLQTWTP